MQERSLADGRLLELIASGDHQAFRVVYDRYYRKVYLYSYRLLSEEETAKEVANEVMLEIWRGAKRFRGESQPSTWIFGIAANKIRREMKRRPPPRENSELLEKEADDKIAPDDTIYRSELREKIRTAIKRLSPEHREVLDLTYYHDLSIGEAAKIMGCPINTVKTRMFYARKRLGTILEEIGIGGSA